MTSKIDWQIIDSGIYQIRNIITNHVYVGSSYNVFHRKSQHLCELKKKSHPNRYLQNVFNKYGESNISFELLENCTIDEMLAKEEFWINELNPKYNIQRTPNRPVMSEQTKKKVRHWWDSQTEERRQEIYKKISINKTGTKRPDMVNNLERRNYMSKKMSGRKIHWNKKISESIKEWHRKRREEKCLKN